MPQSVQTYIETKDFRKVDKAKRLIVDLYRSDVTKFAKGHEARVLSIFDGIPAQLSKKEKNYRLSSLGKSARFRDYEDAFVWLDECTVVNTCLKATDPSGMLAASADMMKIDFLLAGKRKPFPVEVKSGRYRPHASLDKFTARFSNYIEQPVILYTNDVMEADGILHLPLYMAGLP